MALAKRSRAINATPKQWASAPEGNFSAFSKRASAAEAEFHPALTARLRFAKAVPFKTS